MSNDDSTLTIYRLLEIMIGLVTIIGPLVGMMWYVENRFYAFDKRITKVEQITRCILNSALNDVKPTYCGE